ncbi:hypothetical protein [Legionella septentrionalis]|uniref:DUF2970 domain-containing protein n=1 Tax=Legionella septentrionalis TaxID=2498109 RepID=A0A433JK55_9GAMM|nr:hypothetical protein [Legionella septentrionalis]RUQ88662.1 hypothetical protein EKM59_04960 [Legionella septentrionalis]
MQTFYQVLAIAAAGFIMWLLYRTVKGRPELFSRDNLSKSFSSMGLLALILIGFIALLVFILRNT